MGIAGAQISLNVPVPRYTSYPPANFFRDFSEEDYRTAVLASNTLDVTFW